MSETHEPEDRPKVRRYAPQAPAGADVRFPSPVGFPPAQQPPPGPEPALPSGARPRFEQPTGFLPRLSLWLQTLTDRLTAGDEDTWGVERKLNRRLILASAIAAILLAAGLPAWHQFQLSRQGGALLARAAHYEQLEDWSTAADYCWRYITLTGDRTVCRRAAENVEKADASTPGKRRAIELHLLAVAQQESPAARERVAQLAFDLGDDRLVLEQLERIATVEKQETAQRSRLKALSMYRLARLDSGAVTWSDVASALEAYLLIDRTSDLLTVLLADLYRRDLRDRPTEECNKAADLALERLVKADEGRAASWLARHAYRVRYDLPGAEDDLQQALKLAPQDAKVLIAAAQWSYQSGDFAAAAAQFERLAALGSDQAAVYLGWGDALLRSGKPDEAIEVWTQAAAKPLVGLPALLIRLADAKLDRQEVSTAEELLYRVDQALQTLPADTTARDAALWRIGLSNGQARLRFEVGEHAAARDLWQQLINSPDAMRLPEAAAQRPEWMTGLAECQLRLGQLQQAVALFKEVAVLKPDDPRQALRAALAYERSGQHELARDWFVQASKLDPSLSDAWAGLTRNELARQAELPLVERRWDEFNTFLRSLRLHHGNPALVRVLWAQHLNLSGKAPQGLALLERSLNEEPDSETAARSWLLAADQWGTPEDSQRAWRRYVDKFGHSAWSRQVEARRLVQSDQPAEALAGLWTAAREADVDHRDGLVRTATALAVRHQGLPSAISALREFCTDAGTLESWRLLCELCLEAGDYAQLEQIEPRLQAREGDAGVLWRYFRVHRLVDAAEDSTVANETAAEIDRLTRSVEDLAAGWPPGIFLRARVAARRGNIEQAIPLYESAVMAGQRSPVLWQELITALYQTGRVEQANRYLQQMESSAGGLEKLGDVAVDVYLKHGQLPRALELAKAALERRPDDLAAHLWHAQALVLNGQVNEGLAAHFQALAAFPSDRRCWTSLHSLLLEAGRRELDAQLLQQADVAPELEPAWRLTFAAQGQADLGQVYESAKRWRRLLQEFPDELEGRRAAGDFFIARDPDAAIAAWRPVVEREPGDRVTRRKLAAALADAELNSNWSEIERLLTAFPGGGEDEADDLRLWATCLLQRGETGDLSAARIHLEAVVENHRGSLAEDHLQLARVCRALNDEPAAIQSLNRLLNREPQHEAALAAKAETELFFGALHDAAATLETLSAALPDSLELLRLWPQLLHKSRREAEIAAWIAEFLDQPQWTEATAAERARATIVAAEALHTIGDTAAAEKSYRQAVELDPDAATAWADWLVAQDRAAEALLVCSSAVDQGSRSAGLKLCALLTEIDAETDKRWPRFRQALTKLTAPPCDDAALLAAVAERFRQAGEAEPALTLCRRALAEADGNILATLCLVHELSKQTDGAEEAGLAIERAVTIHGRREPLEAVQRSLTTPRNSTGS